MIKILFRTLHRTILCLFLCFTLLDVNGQNAIRIKLKPETIKKINKTENSISQRTKDGYVQTGISTMDNIIQKYRGVELKRVYRYAGKFESRHQKYGLDLWYELVLEKPTISQYKNCIEEFNKSIDIQIAEPLYEKTLLNTGKPVIVKPDLAANDPLFTQQWHYKNIGQTGGTVGADMKLTEAWDIQTGSNNVIVAITDGGIDYTHTDLAAAMWSNNAERYGTRGIDDDNNGYVDDIFGYGFADNTGNFMPDPDGHGTHVAGTVGAVNNNGIGVSGIAGGSGGGNGVRLMSCAVFSSSGGGSGFEEAYVYAADMGAVINQNSWGYRTAGNYEQSVLDAIDYFIANAGRDNSGNQVGLLDGGLVIFAAGNSSSESGYYPAFYSPVMAVASTNHNDQLSWYSNYGAWVDISAPGGETSVTNQGVLSTLPGNTYGFFQGTSMACPHVSGTAALIVSEYGGPGTTPQAVWDLLVGGTDSIDNVNPLYAGKLGSGRLNAYQSLLSPDSISPGKINDLRIIDSTEITVTLSWTATGGSNYDGKANKYEIRYADHPINSANFSSSILYKSNLKPKPSGESEEITVTGLRSGTHLYFAIKTIDTYGNISEISNVTSTTTLDAPIMEFNSSNICISIDQSVHKCDSILIENTGQAPLWFNLQNISRTQLSKQNNVSVDAISGLNVTASPISDTLSPGENVYVVFTFVAGTIAPQNYTDSIEIISNDPANTIKYLNYNVHINGIPQAIYQPTYLDFDELFITDTVYSQLSIINAGTDTLRIDSIKCNNPVFFVSDYIEKVVYINDTLFFTIGFAPLANISYNDSLVLHTNLAQPDVKYPVTGAGLLPPIIAVSPDSFDVALYTGDTLVRQLIIDNSAGNSNLIFEIEIKDSILPVLKRIDSFPFVGNGINNNQESVSNKLNAVFYELGDITTLANSPVILSCFTVDQKTGIMYGQQNEGNNYYQYNPSTNNWSGLTSCPLNSGNNGVATCLNNKIYTTYSDNYNIGIYDIITNTWQTENIGIVPGNITNDGNLLYFAHSNSLYSYNTTTKALVLLSSGSPVSFSNWGGIQYYNNKIYGHSGNSSSSFVEYNIVTKVWTILASIPGGAVLGSAFDYNSEKYYAYGSYGGQSLYEYDVKSNLWTIYHINSFYVNDGGLAYYPKTDKPGIYFIQGENGTGFAKFETERVSDWLEISKTSGSVIAGSNISIDINFDAFGLYGGFYYKTIEITSNAPVNSTIRVPVRMQVTGIPVIETDPTIALDFDTSFVGFPLTDSILIRNTGTDSLIIDSIYFSSFDFSIENTIKFLLPEQSLKCSISYTASTAKTGIDTLFIRNNSSNQLKKIILNTISILPPVITVVPDSFDVALFTGDTLNRTLTIGNIAGGSNLIFDLTITNDTTEVSLANKIKKLKERGIEIEVIEDNKVKYSYTNNYSEKGKIYQTISGKISSLKNDLSGINVLLLANSRDGFTTELELLGANTYYAYSFLPTMLDSIDVLVIDDNLETLGYETIVNQWILNGGCIIIDADEQLANYNSILNGSGIQYFSNSCNSGYTNNIGLHDVTTNISQYYIGSSSLASMNISGNAVYLIKDSYNYNYAAASVLGKGKIVAIGNESLSTAVESNILLGVNAVKWFASGNRNINGWLSTLKTSGIIPSAASEDLNFRFDANGMFGGDYYKTIRISNNDPGKQLVNIPVHLHVTGAPVISADSLTLNFDTTFVGFSKHQNIEIENTGTDALYIDSIKYSTLEFSGQNSTPSILLPGESFSLDIKFAPLADGIVHENLVFYNNSKDSVYDILLNAVAVIPPSITVTPDSFDIQLLNGNNLSRLLTIDNSSGGSELKYLIKLSETISEQTSEQFKSNFIVESKQQFNPMNTQKPVDLYSQTLSTGSTPVQNSFSELDAVLETLNTEYLSILNHIPNYYAFTNGESSNYISDGGNDMYDGGNFINTNFGNNIYYSNNLVQNNPAFGLNGKYFTVKLPGLFLLAADINNLNTFYVDGDLGADGSGNIESAEITQQINGRDYLGFVKRVYNAGDPSVNHLIIIPDAGDVISHTVSINTNSDFDQISGMNNSKRIYYILFSGSSGTYYNNSVFTNVMSTFIELVERNEWLKIISDLSGVVPAGETIDVDINFDATDMIAGNYYQNISILSNDSVNKLITIPAHLKVTGYPLINTDSAVLFTDAYVGYTSQRNIQIENIGFDTLKIDNITSPNDQITFNKTSFVINAKSVDSLRIIYQPNVVYQGSSNINIHYNSLSGEDYIIPVEIDAQMPPEIQVNPEDVTIALSQNVLYSKPILISNNGQGNLEYIITTNNSNSLETLKDNLSVSYTDITGKLENIYNFSEGESGYYISNGGMNMYNYGNYLETNFGGYLAYTGNSIQSSSLFGLGGRYFTCKYPGLFVLAAETYDLSTFNTAGNIGNSGNGVINADEIHMEFGGKTFTGFIKRVYNAGTPSVNHLIIVEDSAYIANQNFDSGLTSDYHRVSELNFSRQLYYLLFAGSNGQYYSNDVISDIMGSFLAMTYSKGWVSCSKFSGNIEGNSRDTLLLNFNTFNYATGNYSTNIQVINNDPVNGVVTIPIELLIANNQPPYIINGIADTTTKVGNSVYKINLNNVFADPESDNMHYNVQSSNSSIAVGTITSANQLIINALHSGYSLFTVTVSDSFMNSNAVSFVLTVLKSTSQISNEEIDNQYIIYPVPSNGLLNIDLQNIPKTKAIFKIYNSSGKLVYEKTKTTGTISQIDLTEYNEGFYILQITYNDYILNKKITLQK